MYEKYKEAKLKEQLLERYGSPPVPDVADLKKFAAMAVEIFGIDEEEVWAALDQMRHRDILYYFKKMKSER